MSDSPDELAAQFVAAALGGCTNVCCLPGITWPTDPWPDGPWPTSTEFLMDGHRFRITVEAIPEPTPAERTADLYGSVDTTPDS